MKALPHIAAQSGQAMSEFLVVSVFLLIPLFLIVPVVASLISQQQDVEIGARYAVWERTAWHAQAPPGGDAKVKSDADIAREIDRRIFAQDRASISSISDADTEPELDPFAYRADSGEALLKASASETAGAANYAALSASQSKPGGLTDEVDQAFALMGRFTRFELERRGLYEADVSVAVSDLNPLFKVADLAMDSLRLSRRNALFAEAWTGGSKTHTEHLVSGLTPQQYFDNPTVRAFQTAAAQQPYGKELGPDSYRPGHVDIDPLPPYRIGQLVPR